MYERDFVTVIQITGINENSLLPNYHFHPIIFLLLTMNKNFLKGPYSLFDGSKVYSDTALKWTGYPTKDENSKTAVWNL